MRINASCKCEMLLLHKMRLGEMMQKLRMVDYSINPSETEVRNFDWYRPIVYTKEETHSLFDI
jgi:hypothetical protein